MTGYNVKFIIAACTAAGMTIASGFAHGFLSNRWGPSNELQLAANHLATFPKEIDGWQTVDEQPMDERARVMLECSGYINRRYTKNGKQVSLAVIVGPPGPTAVHTPEICYSSREYQLQDAREVFEATSNAITHTFWRTKFRSKRATGDQIEVFYAWNDGSSWTASESPRYAYGGKRYLYKIQLASPVSPFRQHDGSACQDFLTSLINSSWQGQARLQVADGSSK